MQSCSPVEDANRSPRHGRPAVNPAAALRHSMQRNKQKTKKTPHFRHVLNDNTTRAHIAATRRSRITESQNMAGKYVREANGAAAPQRPSRVDSQPSKHDSFSSDDSDEDDSAAQSGRRSYVPPVHAAASSNTVAYRGGPSLQVPNCLAHHLLFPTAFPFFPSSPCAALRIESMGPTKMALVQPNRAPPP